MFKNLALHTKIIIGMLLGIVYAIISVELGLNEFTLKWIDPFGVIFIRLLKFNAVPLVLFSIIGGVASLPNPAQLGRMGVKTLLAYLSTTLLAISIGLVLVNVIQPGKHISLVQGIKNRIKYELWQKANPSVEIVQDGKSYLTDPQFADLVEDVTKDVQEESAVPVIEDKLSAAKGLKESGPLQMLVEMVPENIFKSFSDTSLMLQVIFFGIFFGISMLLLPSAKMKPLSDFINSVNEVFLKMVDIIMNAAPFFVFALIAGVLAKMANTTEGVFEIFKGLLSYTLVVLLGLGIMIFVVYPLLVLVFVKNISLKEFYKAISPAQFLAFSTSSSAATLPVTMECVTQNLKVPEKVANFTLPIGATVNMDGTSMYQAIAVVFLAQAHLIDLSFEQNLIILTTAALASIGTAAIPGAGMVMMIIVLQAVGLNPAWIAIIFPVDRILDMCRTSVNVTGDMAIATIIAHYESDEVLNENE